MASVSSEQHKIVLKKRDSFGKSAAKLVKKDGLVPCILHQGSDSVPYSVCLKELVKILTVKRFFLTCFNLVDESEKAICVSLVRDVTYDPITNLPIHIDFLSVKDDSVVLVEVPIIFHNKDSAPGLLEGGQMKLFQYSVRMRVKFKDMPVEIPVDLGHMKLFDIVRVADLPIPPSACVLYLSKNDKVAFMKGVVKA